LNFVIELFFFSETGTKLAVAVSLADPGSEDKGCSRRKGHLEVEVRRTLEKKFVESPYLARQLSMFYHR